MVFEFSSHYNCMACYYETIFLSKEYHSAYTIKSDQEDTNLSKSSRVR